MAWCQLPLYCFRINLKDTISRSSRPKVFLRKVVLKIWTKFTGEHPCRSVISIKLQSNFTEIVLRYGCSPLNLLHIFSKPFIKNTSGWLLLNFSYFLMDPLEPYFSKKFTLSFDDVYPNMVGEFLKFKVFRLLENAFPS